MSMQIYVTNSSGQSCSSSGRLHASPKISFSSVVQQTMKWNELGGMGSGRCLSSASPISAAERQQLWGSSMHHSFDDRPSASSEDLFASCNDIDNAYRQQRKRRAGISGAATGGSHQRDGPFACAGGNGYSSAGFSNGRGFPPLGGRSPQSSFDSNQDVAQISMNWMRMNGLGPSLRPFLNSGNHTPKKTVIHNSQSTNHISRIGSLRRMHAADASIDGKLSLSGTQGETASRKSVSIAYSNDLEAGGKGNGAIGDDSTVPLMDEKDDNSGGRLIRREILHEKRRHVSDRALAFAIMGIILMIIENELRTAYVIRPGSSLSHLLKFFIIFTTTALLSFVGYFHVIEIQLFMNANAADDWMVALSFRRTCQIGLELLICMLCPLPIEFIAPFMNDRFHDKTLYAVNVFLSIMMFFRLYWLCRVMLLHSRVFTDASSRSIAGLNRVNFNARFILKTLMTICPGTMLMIFTAFLWIIAGWILRLCEREYMTPDKYNDINYVNSIWLVAITFLSVGYGDIVPKTNCGRSMAIVTGILGTCASSMVVAVIARKLELTRAEKHVHNFMQDTQLTKQLKHSAANVLRETWFIFKFRKLVEKPDFGKIRKHQRKFLLAIYEMRRVRRDQRKLAENLVSLGDVAKTSSNTYELVHDVHSTQEGLSLRITAIEHQLSDISRELSSLAELLRGSNEQRKKSVVIGGESAPPTPQQILKRKIGELRV
ncbi:Calmodulin-binding domain-containing protein [Caenorhabditis elegans]|uniref:Calmodulin-binding domain-containing protein n=1 Tax=Caenorhabditis elegans TaxID=6239 RepID=V6CLJ1_CAEEL|nr:Calmodulin-binding domain-containing protein [Caenorhabditis elegans]CDK13436.1 Calmodulin-binding domain-containing protein [Caenorhabditis elegans]|eukprot:NP_001293205.1 KCNN (potassium K ChaNNel, calcium activated)-Like [Caenorhabditis elegans]